MKTATLPAVRVAPELRHRAESFLRPGETLSTFIENVVDLHSRWREEDAAFYARGLAAAKRIDEGEKTYTHAEVMKELRALTERKKREHAARTSSAKKAT